MTYNILQDPAFAPFVAALALMLLFLVFEVFSLFLGASLSQLLDGMAPDLDVDIDVDIDLTPDLETGALDVAGSSGFGDSLEVPDPSSQGWLASALAWLTIGRVPSLIILVILLTSFGLVGLGIQTALMKVLGIALPASLICVPAIAVALISTRKSGLFLARIMPKEESDAVSQEAHIGAMAYIFRGNAQVGQPAEAKLSDRHGHTHYVLLEPDLDSDTLKQGETVLIVGKSSNTYRAIRTQKEALV